VTERGDRRSSALNKQRGVDICNFRHTLVSNSHRAHSPYKIDEIDSNQGECGEAMRRDESK
jgi:hypothetical protein